MAEENQDKFTLPIAGVATLLALAGAVFFYQSPLKTSRPIDQEAEKKATSYTRVQSRLWQDPFEAVETHRLQKLEHHNLEKAYGENSKNIGLPLFKDLIKNIKDAGGSSGFRILPVFVDGSPYANGMESRLKDRYAVVSALGAAGYMPESGEYIRYFLWSESTESKTEPRIIIPVERFMPKAKLRMQNPNLPDVLIFWLKDQDFEEAPLALMNKLIGQISPILKNYYQDTSHKRRSFRSEPVMTFGGVSEESRACSKWYDNKLQFKNVGSQSFQNLNDLKDVFDFYLNDNSDLSCLSENKLELGISPNREAYYAVLGPRYSGTLSTMIKELPSYAKECGDWDNRNESSYKSNQNFRHLKDITFYSYWPTVNDNFVVDCLPIGSQIRERAVERLFNSENIEFIRTISADALLAEQLINELKLRRINILSEEDEDDKSCKPTIALISEWDTIYGRTLPRIFAAVAENMARHGGKLNTDELDVNINKLRRDEWPKRIVRYSYLAGLDGELPPKKDSDEAIKTKDKKNADSKDPIVRQAMEKAAEGRDQLDYLQRMVVDLKLIEDSFNDESENCKGEAKPFMAKLLEQKKGFKAIGVLGNDVYDKLLILQALKKEFPQAIFFTIDLDARLLHPEKREWTRNLIVASNFGLQLHPDLQNTIPPFRDNSQTALFYSVFQALGHLERVEESGEKPAHLELAGSWANCSIPSDGCFSAKIKPKLYEIGRDTAVDISSDLPSSKEFKSIHAPRPDVDRGKVRHLVTVETIIWVSIALALLGICAIFISGGVEKIVIKNRLENPLKNPLKNPFTSDFYAVVAILVVLGGLEWWARRSDGAKGEPLVLTQGVSIWPAIAIQVLAIGLCSCFYLHSRYLLNKHDKKLSDKFGLHSPPETSTRANQANTRIIPTNWKFFWNCCFSIPRWHETKDETHIDKKSAPSRRKTSHWLSNWFRRWLPPSKTQRQAKDETNIIELWKEYRERRGLRYSLFRIIPQLFFFSLFVGVLYLKIGFPLVPCRGDVCFKIHWGTALLSWFLMLLLLLYVIDTTRLCRRFISILCEKKFPWPENAKIKNEFRYPAVDTRCLNELCCIDLIGKLTAVVSKLLFFPFIILFLLVVARHSYIDNFDWPIWLAVIYGIISAYAVGIVIALRVTAEKARKGAIEQLEEKLNDESSRRLSWPPSREERKRQIEEVIQKIKDNHEGAFQPFYQYPILGALAVPAGGTGLLYLIDYLAQSF